MDVDFDVDVDESFGQPGAVPFKWEIKPGVPKNQHHHCHCHRHQFQNHSQQQRSLPAPPQKLKPPPAGPHFLRSSDPMSRSVHSSPRTRSDRWRFAQSTLVQPPRVSPGCFPSPLLKRKSSKSAVQKPGSLPKPKPDYTAELETLSRWSVSSGKSLSPFRESLSSSPSSFSSYQSSPRPTSDTEWAGFGLF